MVTEWKHKQVIYITPPSDRLWKMELNGRNGSNLTIIFLTRNVKDVSSAALCPSFTSHEGLNDVTLQNTENTDYSTSLSVSAAVSVLFCF